MHTLPTPSFPCPGGEHIPVTEDNRAEYAHLLTAWHTHP